MRGVVRELGLVSAHQVTRRIDDGLVELENAARRIAEAVREFLRLRIQAHAHQRVARFPGRSQLVDEFHAHLTTSRYSSIMIFTPMDAKFTWMLACGPWPSTLRITPSPNFLWRTRAPSLTPGASSSVGGRNRPAATGREIWMRGRTSSTRSSGISAMKREGVPKLSMP